ncbi:MAG: alpha/beta fold hydrolase [Nannocystaceae bacterium]
MNPPLDVVRRSIAAADGWTLDVLEVLSQGTARGLVIAGHAMMVDRRTLLRSDRPSLVATLAAAGFRVLVPDARGHGASGPRAEEGGVWTYDDLVDDTAPLLALARALAPGLPIALLGHSLFAHTSLAWLVQHPDAPVAAHIGLAMDVWGRGREPSPIKWAQKRLQLAVSGGLARVLGRFPARRLGIGSNDESLAYWRWFRRPWGRADGSVDYAASLPKLRLPCLHVVSRGDRLLARPAAALRLTAGLADREVWHLGHPSAPGELAALAPDHMGVVTDPGSAPLWRALAGWLDRRLPEVA